MDLKEEQLIGDTIASHWYYVAKGKVVQSLLRGIHVDVLIDVGAGSGIFSRLLLDAHICDRAICVDPNYDQEKTEVGRSDQIEYVRQAGTMKAGLILMMDVLEHADDDSALLRASIGQLRAGGLLLITVPAFQFLWSGHDIFLEHKRRYRLKRIEKMVRQEGLQVIHAGYFFGLLFPLVAAIRLCNRLMLRFNADNAESALRPYPSFLNTLLIRLHDVERLLLWPINRLFGLTVVCLAKKPGGQPRGGTIG
jgi:SAM-dependent methyltransferase